jgi:hypothetical protein
MERRQSGCSCEFAECLKLEAWMLGRITLVVLSSAPLVAGNDPAVIQGTFVGEAEAYGISLVGSHNLTVAKR